MKLTIGALVGGIILFIWQFFSYGIADLHYNQMKYTPQQDQILESLSALNLEDGEYYMPRLPKGQSDGQEEFMEQQMGKPWATIQYHEKLEYNFFTNLLRALITNTLAIAILCWFLLQFGELTMKNTILTSLGVGLIAYCTTNYLDSIWFHTDSIPDLIDAIVPWILIGSWLGWWLRR